MWNNNVVRYTVVGLVSVAASTYCLAHGVRLVKRLLSVRREFLAYLSSAKRKDANANVALEPVVVAEEPVPLPLPTADGRTEVNEVLWTNEKTTECFIGDDCMAVQSKGAIRCDSRFCPTLNIRRVIDLLRATKYTLDLAMYSISSHDMFAALLEAQQRKVKIRIITDREMVFSTGSRIKAMMVNGLRVRFPLGSALMHHKFCIMDAPMRVKDAYKGAIPENELNGLLLCGSQNWTTNAFTCNFENSLLTSNKHLVREYETEFERLWNSDLFNFALADVVMQRSGDSTDYIQIE